jgi:hypothetical protein
LLLLLESLLAGWLAAALFAGPELSACCRCCLAGLVAAAAVPLTPRCWRQKPYCCRRARQKCRFPAAGRTVPASAWRPGKTRSLLLLTWRLTPAASRNGTCLKISKDRAIPRLKKNIKYINNLKSNRINYGVVAAVPFLPGGKICRLRQSNQVSVIASREYGLY